MDKQNRINQASLVRVALAAVCGIALCAPAMAQDADAPPPPPQQQTGDHMGGGPGRGAEMQQRQLEHMTKVLNLSPDQVTQIKAIQTDTHQKMMALRDDSSVTMPDRRAKMMAMREDEQTKVKAVLTDDQKTKYEAMRQKEMEHRQERDGERGGSNGSTPPTPPSAN